MNNYVPCWIGRMLEHNSSSSSNNKNRVGFLFCILLSHAYVPVHFRSSVCFSNISIRLNCFVSSSSSSFSRLLYNRNQWWISFYRCRYWIRSLRKFPHTRIISIEFVHCQLFTHTTWILNIYFVFFFSSVCCFFEMHFSEDKTEKNRANQQRGEKKHQHVKRHIRQSDQNWPGNL